MIEKLIHPQVRYAPSEQQWRDAGYRQRGTYRRRLFFAHFGITSARWDRLVEQNKENEQE